MPQSVHHSGDRGLAVRHFPWSHTLKHASGERGLAVEYFHAFALAHSMGSHIGGSFPCAWAITFMKRQSCYVVTVATRSDSL